MALGVDPVTNRNEYQESFWGYRAAYKAEHLTAICEPMV
jgi:hypothetical protein